MEASFVVLSRHARARCQQRSVPVRLVSLVLEHADRRVFVGSGVQAAMITRKRLRTTRAPAIYDQRERLEGLIVLHDPRDGAVITAFRGCGRAARRYRRR